ncbi:MAG: D-alanine--D-alanine ligase [Candidatus Methylomirabilia bacterium]
MVAQQKKRAVVGVLIGGRSAEREVSLRTGAAILAALLRGGHRAVGIDAGRDLPQVLARRKVSVAFIALHGRGGEDGTVQGLLECLGIPYTGSGVLASALAMDKKQSKWVFRAHGLPTPDFEVLARGGRGAWPLARLEPPVVVKPTCEGSSVGVSVVRTRGGLARALASAFRYDPEALVESYVPGRDLTVGVIGDLALAVVEMRPRGGFYGYGPKYNAGETEYLVPAPLTVRQASRTRELALAAHRALGCRGASRVDFRLDERGRPQLIEVNTIPGMTATSLLPKSAAAAGIGFDELVSRILADARLDVSPGCPDREGAR